jgi:protease-4
MRKNVLVGIVVTILLVVLAASFLLDSPGQGVSSTEKGNEIAVVFIEGIIMGGRSGSDFLSGTIAGSMTVMDHLRKAASDPTVGAVVLRFNTPGGSVPASQEIAAEIIRLKETGKPIVASMADVSASAGYYLAALADVIVANPGTITGSLGVYMQVANFEELYEKLGIEYNYIKSGEYKDMGATNRPLRPEEKEILQAMVDDIYQQFIETVAEGRNMPAERVKELADGRIYTGNQAKELGLVDELGNYYDAINMAARMAGITGEPRVKSYYKPGPLDFLLSSQNLLNLWKGLSVQSGQPFFVNQGNLE